MFKTILFPLYLFCISPLTAEVSFKEIAQGRVETQHTPLPKPYNAFKNLYLDTQTRTFYASGVNNALQNAIPSTGRKFHFATFEKLPPALDRPKRKWNFLKGTTLFLFEMPETRKYPFHLSHLLEHVMGIWAFHAHAKPSEVKLIVIACDGKMSKKLEQWEGPNAINRHLLKALFPEAQVKTWSEFIKENRNKSLWMEEVITSDRAATQGVPTCTKINKMLGDALPHFRPETLHRFAAKVHAYAKTKRKMTSQIAVTYIKRAPPRTLVPELEERLLAEISHIPNAVLKIADFSRLTFEEQIDLMANTDVLLAVHGNGLSHILHLPPHASVIEIFPPNTHELDYRLFADARGLAYLGISSNEGTISRKKAYASGAYGAINTPIRTLDTKPILACIRNHKK